MKLVCCDRYHWLPGNPLKLTLTLPDGSTFTAAPALATATAATATAAGQTASAFTFDDVALSPGVVARAAADCLQQPIRVSTAHLPIRNTLQAAATQRSHMCMSYMNAHSTTTVVSPAVSCSVVLTYSSATTMYHSSRTGSSLQ
jgi:hypothetical protein